MFTYIYMILGHKLGGSFLLQFQLLFLKDLVAHVSNIEGIYITWAHKTLEMIFLLDKLIEPSKFCLVLYLLNFLLIAYF